MIFEIALPRELDFGQALRYLGVKKDDDPTIKDLLLRAQSELRERSRPKAISLRAPKSSVSRYLIGEDIARHLNGCDECVLLACTLGAAVDSAQRAANASDMAYAVVLDALASVCAEHTADEAERLLRETAESEEMYLTSRFSPGYGDYPIEVQNGLLDLLDSPRRIGLCATSTHLLTPRKSITALLGLSRQPVKGYRAGCAHCALKERCAYRNQACDGVKRAPPFL